MKERLGRYFDTVMLAMAWIGAVLILFVVFIVSAGAISRFVFHVSITWTTELTEYALLYITFLLAPWVLKEDRHVRVDIVLNVVKNRSPRAAAIMEIVGNVLGVVFFGLLAYYGTLVTIDNFARGVRNPTILTFPKGPLLLVIPVSCACLVIQFARRISYWVAALKTGGGKEHIHAEESPEELIDEGA